jgi:diamine N-acetyltransferase
MYDESISRWFRFDAASKNLNDVEKYIADAINDKNALHFAVADDVDKYLGTVSLKNIETKSGQAEYAIVMSKAAIGTSAAKFATDFILKKGFAELKLNRIFLNVLKDNARAVRFYEKYGWVKEGVFRQALLHKGELKDLVWFSILKEEYKG